MDILQAIKDLNKAVKDAESKCGKAAGGIVVQDGLAAGIAFSAAHIRQQLEKEEDHQNFNRR